MTEGLIQAAIEQGFFEYRANFEEPITLFWTSGRQAEIITAISKVLTKWGAGLENVNWNTAPTNLAQVQLTFTIPSQFSSIQIGVAGVTMTAVNPDWSRAGSLVEMFGNALKALTQTVGQSFQTHQTTLAFHIRPTVKPFREAISAFINTKALDSDDATMFGISVYHQDHVVVMDGSASIPGGMFVKLVRIFPADAQLEEMAKVIYQDEVNALNRLGLKLQ